MEMEVDNNSNEGDARGSSSRSEVVPPQLPHPESEAFTDSPNLVGVPNGNDSGNNDDIEEESSLSPAQSIGTPTTTEKVKRKVARFNKEEFAVLQREATISFNPPMTLKKQLAEELNIDLKRVTGFFNNARSGNYAFARIIKEKQTATVLDDNDSMTGTPTPTVLRGEGTPDLAATSTKRKRQPTKKAREGDGSVRRASRSPAIADAMDVDSDDHAGLTTARSKERGLLKASSKAGPANERAITKTPIGAGFTQGMPPSKSKSAGGKGKKSRLFSNASAASLNEYSHSNQLLADFNDEEGEDDGAFPTVKPSHSMLTSTADSNGNHVLGVPASHAADVPDLRSKSPIMVTRTAGQRPSNIPIVPYDSERAKRAADEAVNEARGLMRPEERERADKNNRIPHRPHGSTSPIDNRETISTLSNNSQSWEEQRAQLQAEVNTQWSERENLKEKMIDLKKQYNEGNATLQLISDKYTAPDCSDEAKAAMGKEFDMLAVQLKKVQKEYATMALRVERLKKAIEARNTDIEKLRGPEY